MLCGVGLSSAASCAAIRCAIDRFDETQFIDRAGEWIVGSQAPLDPPARGRSKILQMAASVTNEALSSATAAHKDIALLLCVSETTRPGRFGGLDESLMLDLEQSLETRFHASSRVFQTGRVGGLEALAAASDLIHADEVKACVVVGSDTFLVGITIREYEAKQRLLTSENSNGFVPGEGAAAVLLQPVAANDTTSLRCCGIGFADETATIDSDTPLKADGLSTAFKAAFADAEIDYTKLDYRLTDNNGEQYGFKEAALAVQRTLRLRKEQFDIWHAADCLGEVGAATVPIALSVAAAAAEKGYAPGPGALLHVGNDDGRRGALILHQGDPTERTAQGAA